MSGDGTESSSIDRLQTTSGGFGKYPQDLSSQCGCNVLVRIVGQHIQQQDAVNYRVVSNSCIYVSYEVTSLLSYRG